MDKCITRWCVSGFELERERTQTAWAGAVEDGAVLKKVAVEMEADVCLQAFGEAFEHAVHVDTVGVRPCVLEVFFEALA